MFLSRIETERAIKLIKDDFEARLAARLGLRRVTAPLFVRAGTGINDDLNGVEKPVSFRAPALGGGKLEIVQSLAKWKRVVLRDLGVPPGEGIYADMNAIRPDERLDALHSLYVDQWDWERVIRPEDRRLPLLKTMVRGIYSAIRGTERFLHGRFPGLDPVLPDRISFVHSLGLERLYPGLSPSERETEFCREHGAAFIAGIGAPLKGGDPHDGRAPDYDDWTTPTPMGPGLNGDIVVWNPVLKRAFEISSMGIRVDRAALDRQLKMTGKTGRRKLYFHRELAAGKLPPSIGGGIGQSRLCMFFLRKRHIGEVQSSVWPVRIAEACGKAAIRLL